MQFIDVFNGDADGLCALVQLRLAKPLQSKLVTGVKRDIGLLKQVQNQDHAHITVLDISFEKNNHDVQRLLNCGCTIEYIDHHRTGQLLTHNGLQISIDLSTDTCTSLIVDKQLGGRFRAWAITAAYGDNLADKANSLGSDSGFTEAELATLKQLGVCINYNGYGANLDDLFFHPAELYKKMQLFETPFEFIEQDTATFEILINGYQQDMSLANQIDDVHTTSFTELLMLPNEKWARRVSGVFGNELANREPGKAHAILTKKDDENYLVSIRAPLNRKFGADTLARQFATGGGRKAAAGINTLYKGDLNKFLSAFEKQFMH